MTRLEVGRIDKPHGLRGEVIVSLSTNRDERVAPGSVLYAGDRALTIEASRPHQNRWIVQFAGLLRREDADALHGAALTADPIDDPDALWIHEMLGAEVVLTDGSLVGTIREVMANPANDILVLDNNHLVPVDFVTGREEGRIVIDPPEGLFDLL
jgi:16S rRNA processing protein RimM